MESDLKEARPIVHVIDDDASLLRAMSRLLRAVGFHVEVFSSAEEFLLHRRESPAASGCAIVDLQLPGLNGLELQQNLSKQNDPLPIVFLTGHGDARIPARAMSGDVIDFLAKPVSAEDLVAAVRRALAAALHKMRP